MRVLKHFCLVCVQTFILLHHASADIHSASCSGVLNIYKIQEVAGIVSSGTIYALDCPRFSFIQIQEVVTREGFEHFDSVLEVAGL